MMQFIIFLVCHPCWEIRSRAYDATKKIIAAAPQLIETLLFEFTNFLSLAAEKLLISKTRYFLVLRHPALISFMLFLTFILVGVVGSPRPVGCLLSGLDLSGRLNCVLLFFRLFSMEMSTHAFTSV